MWLCLVVSSFAACALRGCVLGRRQDGLVATRTLVAAPLLDDVAEIEATAPADVLDRRLASRPAPVGQAVAVEDLGDLDEGVAGQLPPHAAHDLGLLGHDDQLPWVDQMAGPIALAAVAEGVVAPMAAVLELAPQHAGHPLGVEIALELGGEAELAEHEAPGGPVELGARQVGHEERAPGGARVRARSSSMSRALRASRERSYTAIDATRRPRATARRSAGSRRDRR